MRPRKYYFFSIWAVENYSQLLQVPVNQPWQGDIFYLPHAESTHIFGYSRRRRRQFGHGEAGVDGAVGELVDVRLGELKIEN